jgi:hypothetical protein
LTGLSGYGSESNDSEDDDRDNRIAEKTFDSEDDQQMNDEERFNSNKDKESQLNIFDTKPDDAKSNVQFYRI